MDFNQTWLWWKTITLRILVKMTFYVITSSHVSAIDMYS